jgi:hypothetical protein
MPGPESDDDDGVLLPCTRRHTAARRTILATDSESDEPEVQLQLRQSRSSSPIQAPAAAAAAAAAPAAGGDEDGGSDSDGWGVPAWRRDYASRAAGSGVPGASRAASSSSSGEEEEEEEEDSSDGVGQQDDMFSFPDDLPISR